ncbi:RHS repeat-associated core domain-containing protein, partial [Cysteiniphilum halobium]|uniref:RHS repeat-associated core domain-containing protein n=1 Tax=Cysteiniphilum halobium TaxID=2219059 RepID=UPI003F8304D9
KYYTLNNLKLVKQSGKIGAQSYDYVLTTDIDQAHPDGQKLYYYQQQNPGNYYLIASSDQNNQTVYYQYGTNGHIFSVTQENGLTFAIDQSQNHSLSLHLYDGSVNKTLGRINTDENNRISSYTTVSEDDQTQDMTTSFIYGTDNDQAGQLISVQQPTGAVIAFDYTHITLSDGSHVPVVKSMTRRNQNSSDDDNLPPAITSFFDYNPQGNGGHNYLGNTPSPAGSSEDALMLYGSNDYHYQVMTMSQSDVIKDTPRKTQNLVTYNHLHLPIENTTNYLIAGKVVPLSKTQTFYVGANYTHRDGDPNNAPIDKDLNDLYNFKPFDALPSNYQAPQDTFNTVYSYDDQGNLTGTKVYWTHNEYDTFGRLIRTVSYQKDNNDSFQIVSENKIQNGYDQNTHQGYSLAISYDSKGANSFIDNDKNKPFNDHPYRFSYAQSDQYGNPISSMTGYAHNGFNESIDDVKDDAILQASTSYYNAGGAHDLSINGQYPLLIKHYQTSWAQSGHQGIQQTAKDYQYQYIADASHLISDPLYGTDPVIKKTTLSGGIQSSQYNDAYTGMLLRQDLPHAADSDNDLKANQYIYDGLLRQHASIAPDGSGVIQFYSTKNVDQVNDTVQCNALFNAHGQLISTQACTRSVTDGFGVKLYTQSNLFSEHTDVSDKNNWPVVSQYTYDDQGNMLKSLDYQWDANTQKYKAFATTIHLDASGHTDAVRKWQDDRNQSTQTGDASWYDDSSALMINKDNYHIDMAAQISSQYSNDILVSNTKIDDQGNTLSQTDFVGKSDSNGSDVAANTVTVAYDGLSQAIVGDAFVNHATGNASINDANFQIAHVINHYDYQGQIDKLTTLSYGLNHDQSMIISQWDKDLLGHTLQKHLADDAGHQISGEHFVYNDQGQMTSISNNLNQTKTYQYDDQGRITQFVDFSGTVTSYVYGDNQGDNYDGETHLVYKEIQGKTQNNDAQLIEYQYQYNPIDANNGAGKIASIRKIMHINDKTVSDQTILYQYNDWQHGNALIKVTYPDHKTIQYGYDDHGQLISMTDAIGNTTYITYQKDDHVNNQILGRIASLSLNNSDPDQAIASVNYSYYDRIKDNDPINMGQIKTIEIASKGQRNSLTSLSYYGKAGKSPDGSSAQPTSTGNLRESKTTDGNGNILQDIVYTHDDAGHINSIKTTSSALKTPLIHNYLFNANDQLTDEYICEGESCAPESAKTHNHYDYEPLTGNISRVTTTDASGTQSTTYHYDADNRLLSSDGYQYDQNGNMIKDKEGNSYQYDIENRLTAFSSNKGLNAQYSYYPDTTRADKIVTAPSASEQRIDYYYDNSENAQVVNEIEGNTSASYLKLGDVRYLRIYNDGINSHLTWLFNNGKDTSLEKDDTGALSAKQYNAYGSLLDTLNLTTFDISSFIQPEDNTLIIEQNPFGYSDEYTDSESGLQYLRARYYNPKIQRFIQRDPYIATLNKYAYANGDPVGNTDPSGMDPWYSYLNDVAQGVVNTVTGFVGVSFSGQNWSYSGVWGKNTKYGDYGFGEFFEGIASGGFLTGMADGAIHGKDASDSAIQGVQSTAVVGSVYNAVQAGEKGDYHQMTNQIASAVTQAAMVYAGADDVYTKTGSFAKAAGSAAVALTINPVAGIA